MFCTQKPVIAIGHKEFEALMLAQTQIISDLNSRLLCYSGFNDLEICHGSWQFPVPSVPTDLLSFMSYLCKYREIALLITPFRN